ncbi:hypothetical protein EMIHUDRAFT_107504 [Emiliania huxleyi CCMP1516]|uniref:Uncharacterized protein n=2 Tax=Emiliania huxleyi TaxID=2903 RepID=A0A0D3I0N6_EMIH1|nr:hypothetical protein EMIHUDRAFT_107504 [Emiliania huxleyi CCMP1516]EOD04821.1 hypothetical protein EMIHUDRAFT_107504 [Emiliania huxleyi CCMP1516]|eukprot:XP_005757250.1 hypothetical protein EMIHUDRAFT_107504 [Emiliania huxleyi CCMP1516]
MRLWLPHNAPPSAPAAVCLAGQLRVLSNAWLQDNLLDAVLRPLRAALFMHVSRQSRSCGTRGMRWTRVLVDCASPAALTSRAALDAIVHRIAPASMSLLDDELLLRQHKLSVASAPGVFRRTAVGCPYSTCAPLLLRYAGCASDVERFEAERGQQFRWIVRARPDLLWHCRLPDITAARWPPARALAYTYRDWVAVFSRGVASTALRLDSRLAQPQPCRSRGSHEQLLCLDSLLEAANASWLCMPEPPRTDREPSRLEASKHCTQQYGMPQQCIMDPALPPFMQGMAQPGGSIHPAQWEQQAYCYPQPAGAYGAIPPLCGGAGTYPSQAWMPPAAPQPPPAPAPPPAPTPGAGAAPPHAAGSAPANVTVDELRTLLNCASVSGATSASRKSFKALSAAEVNELKTKLVKTDIVPFINRLWRKAYRRGEIFRRLHGFWASGTRSQLVADIAAGDSALLEADTWLADAIGSCLDRSAAAVELFLRRPESNDLYAEAQGVTTLLRIAALARHEPGAAMTQAEQAFDDSKPLFMGMGNDEALLAVTQIASEFGMLSDRCRNTLDVYRAIADKLPAEARTAASAVAARGAAAAEKAAGGALVGGTLVGTLVGTGEAAAGVGLE